MYSQEYFWLHIILTFVAAIFLPCLLFVKSLNKNRGISPLPNSNLNKDSLSEPLSSTADLIVGEYEVFLSFCGKDTRYGFTDFLYTSLRDAGVRTFRDDNELRVGEEIGSELLNAIKDSKILIPIFSKNYASSKWCLIELAQMVECQAERGQMIFPIFYDVDPYEVRHQNGSYEEAFRQYRNKRFNGKMVQAWKEALEKVGQFKGLELKKETGR
ncbi:hypothetical protein LguiB_013407 [Lonicera macranthoides]